MKILIIFPFPPPAHGFSIMGEMALRGLRKDNKVTYIDTAMDKKFKGNVVPSIFSFKRIMLIIRKLSKDIITMFSSDYDIVYMGAGMGFRGFMRYAPYMIMSVLRRTPYVIHLHDSTFANTYHNVSKIKRRVLHNLINNAAGVIVLGDSLRKILEGIIPPEKVYSCKNGVDNYIFASRQEIEHKKINRTTDCRLLFLSNVMRAKGALEMIDAFEKTYNTTLDIAGAIEPDKEVEAALNSLVERYPQRVTYHGCVDKETKRQLYLNSDIFVLPSKNEGQSVTILEAYSCGCAVVTDQSVGGLSDIFRDGINGVSCNHNSSDSIADSINKCRDNLNYYTDTNTEDAKTYTEDAFLNRLYKILFNLLKK